MFHLDNQRVLFIDAFVKIDTSFFYKYTVNTVLYTYNKQVVVLFAYKVFFHGPQLWEQLLAELLKFVKNCCRVLELHC